MPNPHSRSTRLLFFHLLRRPSTRGSADPLPSILELRPHRRSPTALPWILSVALLEPFFARRTPSLLALPLSSHPFTLNKARPPSPVLQHPLSTSINRFASEPSFPPFHLSPARNTKHQQAKQTAPELPKILLLHILTFTISISLPPAALHTYILDSPGLESRHPASRSLSHPADSSGSQDDNGDIQITNGSPASDRRLQQSSLP